MKEEYGGMTVNERLYVSGLMDKFYKAIEEKNIERFVNILKELGLSDGDIVANLKFVGLIDK